MDFGYIRYKGSVYRIGGGGWREGQRGGGRGGGWRRSAAGRRKLPTGV